MLNNHKKLLNEISLQNYPNICIKLVIEFLLQIWVLILVNSPEKYNDEAIYIYAYRMRFILRNWLTLL